MLERQHDLKIIVLTALAAFVENERWKLAPLRTKSWD
jgi:hypothetical protein